MDPRAFKTGPSRETTIRRDARGRWFDGDQPLSHPNLVDAFDTWVDVSPEGRYCLRNAINWAYVQIEGAPLFVRAVEIVGPSVELRLSDGRKETLDPSTLRQDQDGLLYCSARGGTLAAQFERMATHQLEPLVQADEEGVFLHIDGEVVRPPIVEDPLSKPAPKSYNVRRP